MFSLVYLFSLIKDNTSVKQLTFLVLLLEFEKNIILIFRLFCHYGTERLCYYQRSDIQ